MIATLPMYARPETRGAHDALWAAIRDGLRARGVSAPEVLDHEIDHLDGWARPDLVLSEICNLPYWARFRDRVTPIGAADYGLPDTPAGYFRSVWIVRTGDPAIRIEDCAGYRFALNDGLSQSGWGGPLADATARSVTLTPHLTTGAHRASIAAVAEGRADLAAIDAVTWRLVCRHDEIAGSVREIGRTPPSPGMTYVTAPGADPEPFRAAIAAAIDTLAPVHADALGLRGIVVLPASAYDVPIPPAPQAIAR